MYRNLDSETSKKLDRALANKIKVKRFVTRQEADAIKAALGKKDEIRKRTKETDRTSSILKRLDRVDIGKLIKHPGHPDQGVHSPTGGKGKQKPKSEIPRMTMTRSDVGVYADSSRGRFTGERIQEMAQGAGWSEERLGADDELYDEATDDAESWLNMNVAGEGTYFGTSEQGDWGLWDVEEEENE